MTRLTTSATLLALLAVCPVLSAAEFHVAPNGQPKATGTKEDPFASLADAVAAVKASGAPGTTIWMEDGTYAIESTIELKAGCSGTAEAPFTIAAVHPGKVMLTGAITVPGTAFAHPDAASLLEYLPAEARAHVRVASLGRTPAGVAMSGARNNALIIAGGYTLPLARWPNRGFAHIDRIRDKGAIYKEGTTKGKRPTATFEAPIGAVFTFKEAHGGDWTQEIAARIGKPSAHGYLDQDWYYEHHPLAGFSDGAVQLLDSSAYGVSKSEQLPRRVFINGLLSELDERGEWFWDDAGKNLYLWPLHEGQDVSIARNLTMIRVVQAHDVLIRGLLIEGVQSGVRIEEGQRVVVAGCELRNISGTALSIAGGTDHRIQSNDLHDLQTPITANGSDVKARRAAGVPPEQLLAPDGFVIDNNHIWRCQDTRGCHVQGIGWTFTHNLIHDLPGGALGWGGNDVLIADNEFYQVMSILGDWGVIYTGATWWTHGNVVRNNFTHHIFNLPQGHGIAGFYFDDLKQGDTTIGNVFYKAAHRSVKLGGGSAQTVVNNVFIDCHIDITTDAVVVEKMKKKRLQYESGELKRGDKEDYWGRTESVVGPEGWKNAPWTKYPLFQKAMETDPYSPALTTIARNYAVGTIKDTVWLNKVPDGLVKPEPVAPIPRDAFVDPASLNFAIKPGFQTMPGFEPIPFDRIGLVADSYRPSPPDKATYRRAVQVRNANRACFDAAAKYDPVADNLRLFPAPEYLAAP